MLCTALLAGSLSTLWIQLGALLAAGAGVYALAQRRRGGGPRPTSIPLTSHHAVHVVDTGDVRLVVGTGPGAAPRLLCELSRPAPGRPDPAELSEASVLRPGAAASAYRPTWDPASRNR